VHESSITTNKTTDEHYTCNDWEILLVLIRIFKKRLERRLWRLLFIGF